MNEDRNIINIRYEYKAYAGRNNGNDYFLSYDGNENVEQNKKMYIFVHHYDSGKQFFAQKFTGDDLTKPEWIIINDCNISSSTRILYCDTNTVFSNLTGLDLSFNSICDFDRIAHLIRQSPKLKYLDLSNNPIEFQKDLTAKILSANPGIHVINRKRVTPADFYELFKNKANYLEQQYKDSKTYQLCQIHSAVRTIQKDRIYYSMPRLNNENSNFDFIDTYTITAIDLSNCDLVYFDFQLFPELMFIDLSHNHIKEFKFKDSPNEKLLYLDIDSNDYQNFEKLHQKFPNCNISPSDFQNKGYLKSIDNDNGDQLSYYPQFKDLNKDMKFYFVYSEENGRTSSDIRMFYINYTQKCSNRVKFINMNSNPNANEYSVPKEEIRKTLINIFTNENYPINEKLNKLEMRLEEVDENTLAHIESSQINDNCPLYFIASLNLENIEINNEDFYKIFTKCINLKKLIVKFKKFEDKNQTVNQYYFKDFQKNRFRELTYFTISFQNYKFEKGKQFSKFIKNISYIHKLKDFYISGYSNVLSERDEIDTTFKYLRGLNTFNGYQNLIPPTPAQYLAIAKRMEEKKRSATYVNFNNLSFLYVSKSEMINPSDRGMIWSRVLPIRKIKVVDNQENGVHEITNTKEIKDLVNDNREFFDKYPRLKIVNDKYVKKNLKAPSRQDVEKENQQFGTFTSVADKVLEKISKIQLSYVYSLKASSSFTSKLNYFFYSSWNKIERFLIKNNISLSNDFISNYEMLIFYSIMPFLVLKLLFWEPSYSLFCNMTDNRLYYLLGLVSVVLLVFGLLAGLSYFDSAWIDKEVIIVPYLIQFIIFLLIVGLLVHFYNKHIYFRTNIRLGENTLLQEENTFHAFLEFKFLKSKIAYSLLMIMIMPICSIVLESEALFTFVFTYKFLFTLTIILAILYILIVNTMEQWSNIIDYLDLKTANAEEEDDDDENANNRRKKRRHHHNNNNNNNNINDSINSINDMFESNDDLSNMSISIEEGSTEEEITHYLILNKSENQETTDKKCHLNFLYEGALKYKITDEDKLYSKFTSEFRSPTQIFYSSYRYRPLQNLFGFFDILQRILTEVISKYCQRWLFIVSTIMLLYVVFWWPHYNVSENIAVVVDSFGRVLMTLSNFILFSFGLDDSNKLKNLVSYVDILGIILCIVSFTIPFLYDKLFKGKKKEKKRISTNDAMQ